MSGETVQKFTEDLLAVVEELAAEDPTVPSEVDGNLSCFFCGGWTPGVESDKTEHALDCLWVRARKLAEQE